MTFKIITALLAILFGIGTMLASLNARRPRRRPTDVVEALFCGGTLTPVHKTHAMK